MRIIAGSLKGRRLKTPPGSVVRPTSDKLRETLFNIVATRVPGARVLDVCAGTGALGLESLSRGAARAVFIERDGRTAALIAENAARCGVSDRCMIVRARAESALQAPIAGGPFDLVLIDPPYDYDGLEQLIQGASGQVAADGLVVLEHAARRGPPAVPGLVATRTVRSGDSALTLYEHGHVATGPVGEAPM